MKSIGAQIHGMNLRWPNFKIDRRTKDKVIWSGELVGFERQYIVSVEYGLPRIPESDPMFRRFPLVRVLFPSLDPQWEATEEWPLPHVYFDNDNIYASPLCLFDPVAKEWNHSKSIALTTIPWAAEWLFFYEIWLATGKWKGGGRHAPRYEEIAS